MAGKTETTQAPPEEALEATEAQRNTANIRRMAIAPLIGEAIARTASEQSVSSLFD